MARIALSWEKRKKSKGLKLNEYGNKSVECGGVPISFFIVVRITIITDKKSWPPRFRNSIFAKHSESPPTTGLDPCGDLDGVLELTLVCRVHILEPYIHTYENMTWGFMPLARDFPPGLPGLACGGGAPQPCALSWKRICTIFYFERVESVFAQFGGDRRWKNAFNPFRHLFVFTEAA